MCIDKEADESCSSCIKFKTNNHPDFELIEPEEGIIKIERIRLMQEEIAKKPIISNKKVYVISDSDCMTPQAQNCLLKTLEEPPEYAVIILTTSNESKILNTVKSRCMKIPFEHISKEEVKKYIINNYSQEINEELIDMSEGSIGKAINLYENRDIYENLNTLLKNTSRVNLMEFMKNAEVIYKQKEKIKEILDYINVYLYNSKNINCIQFVEDTKRRINQNSNYDMTIDYLLIRIWEELNEKYSRGTV